MKIIEKKYYPWVVVALLWVVALLNYMDRQMLSTMQTSMKADIHELNQAEAFGALMAVFLWVYGLVSPFAGMVADKVNRKWLVVGSLFVWSAVTLAMGYATSFNQLYYLRGIMGISEALYIPSALSLLADWHEGKSRSLAIGIHMTGIYMGQAIGGFGAVVAALLSWKTAFHWFGIIGIVYALVLGMLLHEKPSHGQTLNVAAQKTAPKASLLSGFGVVLSNWVFWVILFFFAVPSLPGWATKNRLIVFGRYLRWIAIGLVGETPSQGARLHQCHRLGHDHSRIGSFRLRPSSVSHCGCRLALWRGLRYV